MAKCIGSHRIDCRGIDEGDKKVLKKSEAEPVIVRIYHDGKSLPLCRYLIGSDCCSASKLEEKNVICPYVDLKGNKQL